MLDNSVDKITKSICKWNKNTRNFTVYVYDTIIKILEFYQQQQAEVFGIVACRIVCTSCQCFIAKPNMRYTMFNNVVLYPVQSSNK